MKIKDFLIPLVVALSLTWAIQYIFFFNKQSDTSVSTNKSFVAPASEQIAEPLDLDVDFYDSKPTREEKIITIDTSYGSLSFSNNGAILERLTYTRRLGQTEGIIETVSPPTTTNKENGAFLVALNNLGNTPYYYNLLENKTEGDITSLVYKGQTETAIVTKQFLVHNNNCQIDLLLTVEPKKSDSELRARIFLPGPIVYSENNHDQDVNKAVIYSEKGSIEKRNLKDISLFGKENPTLFGLEDHYFINILIKDPNSFAKRAYFKIDTANTATAIFQSPIIKEKATWKLSFYCGPKELSSFSAVDERLNDVLEYGWFWFISKPLLYLLNFLYSIFKNYGLAIIVLTILIRLVLLPFTFKGEESRKKSVEMQRKLKYIEQRYKDDPDVLAREKAEIFKRHGFGMLGCLPILLQIPIFIGLNRVLANAIELYKAEFLWIPDLASRDPYYILPILVGIGMALQTAQVGDTKQRLSNILIAIVIAAITSNLSAGLALYIAVSTLLGVAQTYIQRAVKI